MDHDDVIVRYASVGSAALRCVRVRTSSTSSPIANPPCQMIGCRPSLFGKDGADTTDARIKPCCAKRLNPSCNSSPQPTVPVLADDPSVEDDLKRFPLFASLTQSHD